MKIEIDVEQFAHDMKAGKSIGGKDGALGSLIKLQKTEQIGHQRRSQFGQHNVKHSVSMTEMIRSLFKKTVL